jgi:hypothetical protein
MPIVILVVKELFIVFEFQGYFPRDKNHGNLRRSFVIFISLFPMVTTKLQFEL